MKLCKIGQTVEVYVTQYENFFERTGKMELLLTGGVIRDSSETYCILEDREGRLHFISYAKYDIRIVKESSEA